MKRSFTYDAVYNPNMSQNQLYQSIQKGTLLSSFLDGYNATIIAYGQTGSGKTFTMGSEAEELDLKSVSDGELGLIPRFMSTIFSHLHQRREVDSSTSSTNNSNGSNTTPNTPTNTTTQPQQNELVDFSVSASFLEVYGEDIRDLLKESDSINEPLPLREDATGGVIAVGLTHHQITSAEEALRVLQCGTMNRTTAATLMNSSSSRSHAVFTIYLTQTFQCVEGAATASDGGVPAASSNTENGDINNNPSSTSGSVNMTTTSKFTFVDLAGSERMKKTGAEGERAREGIEINKGLLALGNVINALADDEMIKQSEKKIHVPYRHSKLTRLLQDALGGNSQTLFLACVSPSDTNASETLSTLKYANRARNIQNAPTKNMDANVVELQRLYALTQVLQNELVKARFGKDEDLMNVQDKGDMEEEESKKADGIGMVEATILQSQKVQDYLNRIHGRVDELQGTVNAPKGSGSEKNMLTHVSERQSRDETGVGRLHMNHTSSIMTGPTKVPTSYAEMGTTSVSHYIPEAIDETLVEVNPNDDIALLDKLLELQHIDQEFDSEHKKDQEAIIKVDGQLEQEEELLLQLKTNMKAYQSMKTRFETLMVDIQQLEQEKSSLALQLDQSQKDPTTGCSQAIKRKLETVEQNLVKARGETRKHQKMYRNMQQEAQKVTTLEAKIASLKQGKVSLLKKQKETSLKHRQSTEAKTREIQTLKKTAMKTGRQMTKLEAEVVKHKANLQKRKDYCDRLTAKLKETEANLLRVRTMRKRKLHGDSDAQKQARSKDVHSAQGSSSEDVIYLQKLLDEVVQDRVSKAMLRSQYETRIEENNGVMRNLVEHVKDIQTVSNELEMCHDDEQKHVLEQRLVELNEIVEELETKQEIIGSELDSLQSQIPSDETTHFNERSDKRLQEVIKLSANSTRSLLWTTLDSLIESEVETKTLQNTLRRKEAALHSFEVEIQSLNNKINSLSKQMKRRRSISSPSDGENDYVTLIEDLQEEISSLKQSVHQKNEDKSNVEHSLHRVKEELSVKEKSYATMAEKMTVIEVAMKNASPAGLDRVEETLNKLQSNWENIGASLKEREMVRQRLDSCLEDTCQRALQESHNIEEKKENEIRTAMQRIESMYSALNKTEQISGIHFALGKATTLKERVIVVTTAEKSSFAEYSSAKERRSNIIQEGGNIIKKLRLSNERLSPDLIKLLKTNDIEKPVKENVILSSKSGKTRRAEISKEVEVMINSISKDPKPPLAIGDKTELILLEEPNSLSEDFLDRCERDVKELKILKAETIALNQSNKDTAKKLTDNMHLRGRELVSISIHSIKKRYKDLPSWWNPQVAEDVCRTIVGKDHNIGVHDLYTRHLDIICESLRSTSKGRETLSKGLKDIVQDAHITLLSTVEGADDASEAHTSFHEALSRLPSLSKEHIYACLEEMNILVLAVEAMTQSEIEALTVVWEALSINSSERGNFWSRVEESTKAYQSNTEGPLDSIRTCTADIEEWVLIALKNANKVYRSLRARLIKLKKVHSEVESLRSKQDRKSKIMSLDSEIRILSAKLTVFEEKAGSRQRLVAKKLNSSELLKEERFRKQMQGSFSSKLKSLGQLVDEWEVQTGEAFDEYLLSEDVRRLLEPSGDYGSRVDKHTAFMHLKTIKQKPRRRNIDRGSDSGTSVESNETKTDDNASVSSAKVKRRTRPEHIDRVLVPTPGKGRERINERRKTATARKKGANYVRKETSYTRKTISHQGKEKAKVLRPTSAKKLGKKSGSAISKELTPLSESASNRKATTLVKSERKDKALTINSGSNRKALLPFGHILATTPTMGKENFG